MEMVSNFIYWGTVLISNVGHAITTSLIALISTAGLEDQAIATSGKNSAHSDVSWHEVYME